MKIIPIKLNMDGKELTTIALRSRSTKLGEIIKVSEALTIWDKSKGLRYVDVTRRRLLMTELLERTTARPNMIFVAVNSSNWYIDTDSMYQSILNIVRRERMELGVWFNKGFKRGREVLLYKLDSEVPYYFVSEESEEKEHHRCSIHTPIGELCNRCYDRLIERISKQVITGGRV